MNLAMNPCKRFFAALFVLALASGGAGIAAAPASFAAAQQDNGGKASVTATIFSPDKGKFRILLDGQAIGNEEFEISASGGNWLARGSTTAHVPGGTDIKASGQLTLSADGAPIHYDWSAQALKKANGVVDFANGTAKCSANLGGTSPMMKDFKFDSPRIAVLDNNLYHQYAVLARVYDWSKRGTQTFPVLIPQELTPGSITVESTGSATADGKSFEGLKVTTADLEILLLLDTNHRLMRLEVPSAKVSVVRE